MLFCRSFNCVKVCLRLRPACVGAHPCLRDTYSVEVWKRVREWVEGVCVCAGAGVCYGDLWGPPIIYPGERKGECTPESIPEGRKIEKEEKRRQGSLQQAEQCCVTGVS